jgi:hypothetical protein
MNVIHIDPHISRFVIFSGGGGLITRDMEAELEKGDNQLQIKGIPASFDPETFNVSIAPKKVKLLEIVIKKPNRRYVEDSLEREASAATRLINESKDIGTQRGEILEICEAISLRTYLDEEVHLLLWLISPSRLKARLQLSYFIDDDRFSWKPTITVDQRGEGDEVRIQGLIAIRNESAVRFDGVEVNFADFAKDFKEGSANYRVAPRELRQQMLKSKMKVMLMK